MGDSGNRDSLADFGRAAMRSRTIRKAVIALVGAAVSGAWGWLTLRWLDLDTSVQKHEAFIADAGVAIEQQREALKEAVGLVDDRVLNEHARRIELYRDMLRTNMHEAPLSRVQVAVKKYDDLVMGQGIDPREAMDRVLGWSRPPER